jgi:8-oxo-dGTP diphosphatase
MNSLIPNDPLQVEVRVVIFSLRDDRLSVLLQPAGSAWQLPGQQVRPDQSLEQAASACQTACTGVSETFLEQLYTLGDPQRRPGELLISIVYFALLPDAALPAGHSLPAGGEWFGLDQLPALVMDHAQVVTYALRRLRYKLEYTAAGFELLPEHFTLSQIQHTYEIILGEKLDKRNFRRRILEAGIIEPTPLRKTGEGRPAQLYRYRPDAVAEIKARRLFP